MLNLKEVEALYERRCSQPFPSILIFGPPGAGKGTLSKLLVEVAGVFHLSTGDIFRGLSKETELGRRVAEVAAQGHFITDDITLFMWKKYVDGLILTNQYTPESQWLLLDGIPRTRDQADQIAPYLDVRHIIMLEIQHEDELIRRLRGRAVKEGRADDLDEEVLRRRQAIYREKTAQVLQLYPQEKIRRVDAEQPIACVLRDVLIALGDSLALPLTATV